MSVRNDKYIFISYSHKDSDIVVPLIEGLKKRNYNVWYDSGIEAGTEWPEYIAEKLMGCEVVIALLSKNSVNSHNCRREINFAIEIKKPLLVIYLEDLELTPGMRMQLNTLQAMFKNRCRNTDEFIEALSGASIIQPCLTLPEALQNNEPKEDESQRQETKEISSSKKHYTDEAPEKSEAPEAPETPEKQVTEEKKATFGKIDYYDGCFYEGELIDGKPNGMGKYVSDIFTKEGFFVDGKLNGKGKKNWYIGDVEEGDFVNGILNGKGKIIHSFGDVDEGDFVNGRLHGKGKSTDKNGNVYEGSFAEGKLNGWGKLTMIWGISVEGEFVRYKLVDSGRVKITFADSFVYEGTYTDGKITGTKNGTDFYMDTNCRIAIGKFLRGKLNGKGETFSTYMKTEGDFTDGFLNGKGKKVWADGSVEEGTFTDDELDGKGKKIRAHGSVEEGTFVRGKLYKGMKILSKSGRIYKGKWENGDLINGYICDKNGKKIKKVVDGVKKDIGPLGF